MTDLQAVITSRRDYYAQRIQSTTEKLEALPNKNGIRGRQYQRQLALFRDLHAVARRYEKLEEVTRALAMEPA